MSNFVNKLLTLLEQTITGLGGIVPAAPAPFNRDERSVQLLDLLRLRLGTGSTIVTYSIFVPTQSNYEYIFVAPFPCRLTSIRYIHTVADSASGSMDIYLVRLPVAGNYAPGGGGFALHSSPFNGKATAFVAQARTYFLDQSSLDVGDRLSLAFSTAPTELRGVHVTVSLLPV